MRFLNTKCLPDTLLRMVLIIGVLISSISAASAQNKRKSNLCGVVVDTDDLPIPFAMVTIKELGLNVVTDIDGSFCFSKIATGVWGMKIQCTGFINVDQVVEWKGRALVLRVQLDENIMSLNEVVVDYDIEEEKQMEGYAVEVLPTKVLQNQSISLNYVLDQTAGVKVRQLGGLGSRVNYSMNGLGGRSIRFFLDGIPMEYFGASYSINTIPIGMIDRIDVYKGVVPVSLSNDALGGAINLTSKRALGNMAELAYSFGSFNTHRVSFFTNLTHQKTGLSLRLSTFYNHSDNNYEIWGKNITVTNPETFEVTNDLRVRRFHDAFSSKSLKADIGFKNKQWADQFFIGWLHSDMEKEIQHGVTMVVPFGEAKYYQDVSMPYLQYEKYDLLNTGLAVNLFSSYSTLHRSIIDTSINIYNWYGQIEGNRSLGGELFRTLNTLTENVFLQRINLNYQLSKNHQLSYTYFYSHLKRTEQDPLLTQKTQGYWAPQFFDKNTMGLSWDGKWLTQKLTTALFVKNYTYKGIIKTAEYEEGVLEYSTVNTVAANLGYGFTANYLLWPSFTVNASFEQASRLPESEEVLGDGVNILSTTELVAETSTNFNLGFHWTIGEKGNNKVKISSNYFYRDVNNLIQVSQFNQSNFVFINFKAVNMQGVDTQVEFQHIKKFTLSQSVSYLNPIIKSKNDEFGNDNIAYNTKLPNTPLFQTNTNARYHLEHIFQRGSKTFFYWTVSYVGSFYRHLEHIGQYEKDVIPAQLINSLGISYVFSKEYISMGLDVQNVFDEQAFDNYAIQKPGRAIYLKMTFKISQLN